MKTNEETEITLINVVKPITINHPHDEPNPIEDAIKQTMKSWQHQLAIGVQIENTMIEVGNGHVLELNRTTEDVEWKQMDGKPVKVVSFNIFATLGELRYGNFLPLKEYTLESFKDPLSHQDIEIA